LFEEEKKRMMGIKDNQTKAIEGIKNKGHK
jgi:hypothetical protein